MQKKKNNNNSTTSRKVSSPSKMKTITIQSRPVPVVNTNIVELKNQRFCDIVHTEPLGDIISGPSFSEPKFYSYDLSASTTMTFPWLSGIAARFEKVEFLGLEAVFCGNSKSDTTADVTMGFDTDPNDSAPLTPDELLTYQGTKSFHPCSERITVKHPMLPRGSLYCSASNSAAIVDRRTTSPGNLFLFSRSYTTDTVVGRLFLSYRVRFHTPQFGEGYTTVMKVQQTTNAALTGYFHPLNNVTQLVSESGQTISKDIESAAVNLFTEVFSLKSSPGFVGFPAGTTMLFAKHAAHLLLDCIFDSWTTTGLGSIILKFRVFDGLGNNVTPTRVQDYRASSQPGAIAAPITTYTSTVAGILSLEQGDYVTIFDEGDGLGTYNFGAALGTLYHLGALVVSRAPRRAVF